MLYSLCHVRSAHEDAFTNIEHYLIVEGERNQLIDQVLNELDVRILFSSSRTLSLMGVSNLFFGYLVPEASSVKRIYLEDEAQN